jgi:hypothetical protein
MSDGDIRPYKETGGSFDGAERGNDFCFAGDGTTGKGSSSRAEALSYGTNHGPTEVGPSRYTSVFVNSLFVNLPGWARGWANFFLLAADDVVVRGDAGAIGWAGGAKTVHRGCRCA